MPNLETDTLPLLRCLVAAAVMVALGETGEGTSSSASACICDLSASSCASTRSCSTTASSSARRAHSASTRSKICDGGGDTSADRRLPGWISRWQRSSERASGTLRDNTLVPFRFAASVLRILEAVRTVVCRLTWRMLLCGARGGVVQRTKRSRKYANVEFQADADRRFSRRR